ncbi:GDP-mannose 4,6-dehydratase [Alphaproteobacteria bacterium]|nr:GDP-mannose 4,6-dehydratase [Alphaproteobacteria bacterium]
MQIHKTNNNDMKTVLVTGTAGFIGFHFARLLLKHGYHVYGYDGVTDYYDIDLKTARNKILLQHQNYTFRKGMLEDDNLLNRSFSECKPDFVVHLAAQAGVRYSIEAPEKYISSNLNGFFNVLECVRKYNVKHFLLASTSSVYGSNTDMPYREHTNTSEPMTLYAATKKANEVMAQSYAHLWNIPTTAFRFFTVYGPWGRPDMALFKFTKNILENLPIDVYNKGLMYRDFTYVDDLIKSIILLMEHIPDIEEGGKSSIGCSQNAPMRVVNIGNSKQVKLFDFIKELEENLGRQAKLNLLPIQPGDVPATWANCDLLHQITKFKPNTPIKRGIKEFVNWYKEYYFS